MRVATVERKTAETDIAITINLDGEGKADINTGVGFFDHMLNAFCKHGLFDLEVRAVGDLQVDAHHTVEDTGIVLGQAIAQALGDKRGIVRFADCAIPMDEALFMCAMDISGRGGLYWDADIPVGAISTFDTQLAREFFDAFAANAGITLHMR
jgi:imidazoleglycerol-phosphate dehydratase